MPVMTRLSVLASHSERVFSWIYGMRRLDWNLAHANAIRATHDEWVFTITFRHDGQWLRGVEPIQDRGPDWRKWFTTAYLQDAIAIAEALAAGADLS